MRNVAHIALLLIGANALHAQWDLPVPLVLDGNAPEDRQVEGAAAPMEPSDAVPLASLRAPVAVFGHATGTNALLLDLVPAPLTYQTGMVVTFVPQAHNTGPATLDVAGLGAMPLLKTVDHPLDSADLRPGVPVKVAFDGEAFQVLSQLRPPCPAGTIALAHDVCIDTTASTPRNFYASNLNCMGRNGRLCTFAEWVTACEMNGGIQPSVADFEWVDHAANDANKAKRIGWNEIDDVQDCRDGGLRIPNELSPFRCCFDR